MTGMVCLVLIVEELNLESEVVACEDEGDAPEQGSQGGARYQEGTKHVESIGAAVEKVKGGGASARSGRFRLRRPGHAFGERTLAVARDWTIWTMLPRPIPFPIEMFCRKIRETISGPIAAT